MHGFSSGPGFLVDAEVDSMGGVVEGGVAVGNKTSPRRAAIEKVQAELRQEYDVREERRRELEYLEKGGNPLDFKIGSAASLSVQSTSLTDQHPDRFVTSEARGSFAASPHGDSVESSGRPGAPALCEPNSADNLMLFDGDNELPEADRSLARRSGFAPSEHLSRVDANQDAKELKDSAAFSLPRKAYKRRSRPNRDGARTGSANSFIARGGQGSSLSSCHVSREVNGLVSDAEVLKEQNVSTTCNATPTSPNRVNVSSAFPSHNQLEMDGVNTLVSAADLSNDPPNAGSDPNASKSSLDAPDNKRTLFSGQNSSTEIFSEGHQSLHEKHIVDTKVVDHQPCLVTSEVEDQSCCEQMNGSGSLKGNRKSLQNCVTWHLAPKNNLRLHGIDDSAMSATMENRNSCMDANDLTIVPEEMDVKGEAADLLEEKKVAQPIDVVVSDIERNAFQLSRQENGSLVQPEEELKRSSSCLQHDTKDQMVVKGADVDCATGSETDRKEDVPSKENIALSETALVVAQPGSVESFVPELPEATPSLRGSSVAPEGGEENVKVAAKVDEDSILEEASIIEAKRKRIAELSVATFPAEIRRRSHWDYVIEEMAWLANDFAQERLWKINAAAQICHQVAFTSRLRFQKQHSYLEQKRVAHVLSKAVMEFWVSVEEPSKGTKLICPQKDSVHAIQDYAVRFLKFNSIEVLRNQVNAPVTPDKGSDFGIMDMSWDDHWTEESLFYSVPLGAMEAYRKLIENRVMKSEITGSCFQEEVETSAYDAVADFGSQDNAYGEDEGEISTYDCDVSKSSTFAQRKRKHLRKGYGVRSDEVGTDVMYTPCLENKVGNHQSVSTGKRPGSSLNMSIPTKRVRTAARQRVISPFTAGTSNCVQLPSKNDASSGDTSSFQDEQTTLPGGSHMPNSLEVESVGNFEKQLPFDSTEVSKPRKKKKPKHLVSAYEQRWQVDSQFQNEQRDHFRKGTQSHHLESNGLFGQPVAKKPKMMRPMLDTSFDNITPVSGSVPSPVGSQMSNMSSPNKLIKILGGGRDRGRKSKPLKVPAGQYGSGSPWSLFEDQALVVLVHDMGPNWELVSDAINSTLQFKCIYRKPTECQERHKSLMDRNSGDGADSTEDSGSSQPYPSTLPGIPKGSARQLFQRLQGPMEEDTLKSHFEKIIMIAKKQHYQKTQKNENHNPRQIQEPHPSHEAALLQVCPNNASGGPVLTPLDLCEATTSSPDILSLGYQSPHCSGLPMANQGTVAPMLPASGANSALQGSANSVIPNNFSPSSGSLSNSSRYGAPRPASLSNDEQQRMQHYNQILASRNPSAPGALPGTERGVRMLPGGNGLTSMGGVNRNLPMARPGFQAMASSSMLNTGSMLSSGVMAIPSPVNLHPRPGPGQGNSMIRPRDAMHMMAAGQNHETQRPLMAPDLPMQASQANHHGTAPYNGTPSFPNQTTPPVSGYPFHHQQSRPISSQQPHMLSPHPHLQGANHANNAQHQAYAIRLAKEKHLQQRFLQQQQQQQQFATSNSLMPRVQPQSQLPITSTSQNSPQIQSQTASPPVSFSPLVSSSSMTMPQHQQKHKMPPHGHARNSQTGGTGLGNQMGKQRQRQPQQQQQQQFQHAGRHHPQQRQQSQSQQQTKLVKGVGRGNMAMQQNIQTDPSLVNGLPKNLGQSNERGEQATNLMQGQGSNPISSVNPVHNIKQVVPPNSSNQLQPQQKVHPNPVVSAAKHAQERPSLSDTSSQGHTTPVASSGAPLIGAPSNNQQPQQHTQLQVQSRQKLVNHNPSTSQRVLQQNSQVNTEQRNKLQMRPSQSEQYPSTSMPQAVDDAINGVQVSTYVSQWKASEPLQDSATSTSASTLASGTLHAHMGKSEEVLDQRQYSTSLPQIEHEVNTQRQHSSTQLQQPLSPPCRPQQQELLSAQQSQQQAPVVQVGNNSLYVTPGESRQE